MNKQEIETQLAARITRATELRELRDKTNVEADALDLKVQNGEFKTAGPAANKAAELAAVERALGVVVKEQLEFQSQLNDIEAERLREIEVERVREVASELKIALDRRDARIRDAAATLETEMKSALGDWSEIWALQIQLDRVASTDETLLREAGAIAIRTQNKDVSFLERGQMHQTPGAQGARICYNIVAQNHR